ncbi:MAG: hypothetical protein M3Q44_04510 [bacterium]|nr:hypothetical protein [bacterium]
MEVVKYDPIRNLPGNQAHEVAAFRAVIGGAAIDIDKVSKADQTGNNSLLRFIAYPGPHDHRFVNNPGALRVYVPRSGKLTYTLQDSITAESVADLRDGTLESGSPRKRRTMPNEGAHVDELQQFLGSYIDFSSSKISFRREPWVGIKTADNPLGTHLRLLLYNPLQWDNFELGGLYFQPTIQAGRPGQSYEKSLSETNHGNLGWLLVRRLSQ